MNRFLALLALPLLTVGLIIGFVIGPLVFGIRAAVEKVDTFLYRFTEGED